MSLPVDAPPLLELTPDDAAWIDDAADPAARAAWPERLAELVDVLAAELRRHREGDAADALAAHCAAAVARYLGGRQVYLPLGEQIDAAVLRLRIYRAWSRWSGDQGAFIDAAIRRYRVSHETVYTAIREGRRRHIALHQARLL